jgi:hypothetical protein
LFELTPEVRNFSLSMPKNCMLLILLLAYAHRKF